MTPAVGETWRRKSSGQLARIADTDSRYVYTEPISIGRRARVLTDAFTRQWVRVDTTEET